MTEPNNSLRPPESASEVARIWERYWRGNKKLALDSYMHYFWKEHLAHIMPVVKSLSEESAVIDVGVGTGSLLKMINEIEGLRVVGLDISRNAIRNAKLRLKTSKSDSSLVLGDIFNLPFRDGTFEVVICLGLIEHFKDSLTPLSNVLKLIKKGGYSFISVPQRRSLYTPYKHWQIRRKTWPFGFEKEFMVSELREIYRTIGMPRFKIVGVDFYPSLLKILPFEVLFRPLIVKVVEILERRIGDPTTLAHMLMTVSAPKN